MRAPAMRHPIAVPATAPLLIPVPEFCTLLVTEGDEERDTAESDDGGFVLNGGANVVGVGEAVGEGVGPGETAAEGEGAMEGVNSTPTSLKL